MTEVLRIAVRKFGPFEDAIKAQFADFVATTGADATLETSVMELDELHAATIAAGGLRDGTFDIAFLATDWIAEAQEAGGIDDLSQRLDHNPPADYPTDWPACLLGLQSFARGVWGLPYHNGPQCLIYRTDLFDSAGLMPPTSWAEFHDMARSLGQDSDADGTLLALYPDAHNIFYDYCIHLWSRGGHLLSSDGALRLTTPESVAALEFIATLANDEKAVAADLAHIDSIRACSLFAEGKVAMMTNWFGFAAYAQSAPESVVKGKVGVAPIPSAPDATPISLAVYWLLALASGSSRKGLAWAFMCHAVSPKMDSLLTRTGGVGTRKSTWQSPDIQAKFPFSKSMDELHACARTLPSSPHLPRYAAIVGDLVSEAVRLGGAPPIDTLIQFEARARQAAGR